VGVEVAGEVERAGEFPADGEVERAGEFPADGEVESPEELPVDGEVERAGAFSADGESEGAGGVSVVEVLSPPQPANTALEPIVNRKTKISPLILPGLMDFL